MSAPSRPIAAILLAAGKGTRMRSELPKVLHPLAGAPLLHHAIRTAQDLGVERLIIIAGHEAEKVRLSAQEAAPDAEIILQEEQLGTGHAVAQAEAALADHDGDVIILYGDVPLLSAETLMDMRHKREKADLVILGFEAEDPARYGRLIVDGESLERIVEYKDATEEERAIHLCNSGVLLADRSQLFALVQKLSNENSSGEYYLTDIIGLAKNEGLNSVVALAEEAETTGVNTPEELNNAATLFQSRRRAALAADGVRFDAAETVIFSADTEIGRGAHIEAYVVFSKGVSVESGAHIRAFSHLENCHISAEAMIGPYARIRPGSEIGPQARIGNFVEVKNAVLEQGAKVNHLSYIGDAHIGSGANIGAGTVTCNYDGVSKHQTIIGERAFVGSGSMLVAPVEIGPDALIGSGSVITRNVEESALAIARAQQKNKLGYAKKLMNLLRAKRAKGEAE